jgi:hypothetical protein
MGAFWYGTKEQATCLKNNDFYPPLNFSRGQGEKRFIEIMYNKIKTLRFILA